MNLCPINRKFFVVNNRNVLSTEYRKCKKELIELFKQPGYLPPEKPYEVTIESDQYSDVDSKVKIICDALEGAGIIENDKYIEKLEVIKYPIKRGGDEVHIIRVKHYG